MSKTKYFLPQICNCFRGIIGMHFSVKHVLKTISCVLIAAHPNKFNQGVTPEMRVEDR